ncbi:hypothetical protein D3C86_1462570 [compost metagenome]
MEEPMEREKLLKEYFSAQVTTPPHLVSITLWKIRERNHTGALIGAAGLNLILVLLLAIFLLGGPLLLFWKIIILMMFCLFQAIATALLVYNIFGSPLDPSAN